MKDVELPKLKKQLAETTGLFKCKKRKAQLEHMQSEIDRRLDQIRGILKDDADSDAQAFVRTFNQVTALVEEYNHDLTAWEQQMGCIGKSRSPAEQIARKREHPKEAIGNAGISQMSRRPAPTEDLASLSKHEN